MSSKAALLPLVLLSVIYIQSTSSQNAWCAILDHQAKHAGDQFWSNLPTNWCATFVYVVPNIDDIDQDERVDQLSGMVTKGIDILLAVRIPNDNYKYVTEKAVQMARDYFSGLCVMWDEEVTKKTLVLASRDIFKTRDRNQKIVQLVTCSMGSNVFVDEKKVDMKNDYDNYLMLAEGTKDDIKTFYLNPMWCSQALGVDSRVILGLGQITSQPLGYKVNCLDKSMKKLLIDVADAVNCVDDIAGSILWGLSTDDFTGGVCKENKYPHLNLYAGGRYMYRKCASYLAPPTSCPQCLALKSSPLLLICAIGVSIFDGRL